MDIQAGPDTSPVMTVMPLTLTFFCFCFSSFIRFFIARSHTMLVCIGLSLSCVSVHLRIPYKRIQSVLSPFLK